jgi:hypothetical protein
MSASNEPAPEAPVNKLNAKQQSRIQKRRLARQQLVAHLALVRNNNTPNPLPAVKHTKLRPISSFLALEQATNNALANLRIQDSKGEVAAYKDEKPRL